MPFLIIFFAVILFIATWLANQWVATHGVATLVGTQWDVTATGWQAVGLLSGGFVMTGMIFGGLIGFLAGSKIWGMFVIDKSKGESDAQKKVAAILAELAAQKIALDRDRWAMTDKIDQAVADARHEVLTRLETAEREIRTATHTKNKTIGRLKGAQAKCKRIEKRNTKALLTSPDGAKPSQV